MWAEVSAETIRRVSRTGRDTGLTVAVGRGLDDGGLVVDAAVDQSGDGRDLLDTGDGEALTEGDPIAGQPLHVGPGQDADVLTGQLDPGPGAEAEVLEVGVQLGGRHLPGQHHGADVRGLGDHPAHVQLVVVVVLEVVLDLVRPRRQAVRDLQPGVLVDRAGVDQRRGGEDLLHAAGLVRERVTACRLRYFLTLQRLRRVVARRLGHRQDLAGLHVHGDGEAEVGLVAAHLPAPPAAGPPTAARSRASAGSRARSAPGRSCCRPAGSCCRSGALSYCSWPSTPASWVFSLYSRPSTPTPSALTKPDDRTGQGTGRVGADRVVLPEDAVQLAVGEGGRHPRVRHRRHLLLQVHEAGVRLGEQRMQLGRPSCRGRARSRRRTRRVACWSDPGRPSRPRPVRSRPAPCRCDR